MSQFGQGDIAVLECRSGAKSTLAMKRESGGKGRWGRLGAKFEIHFQGALCELRRSRPRGTRARRGASRGGKGGMRRRRRRERGRRGDSVGR